MSESSPWVLDVSEETFDTEVMERSRSTVVVVDFWSPTCGPCMQLGPVLEGLASEYSGRFVLAKVNVDQQPRLAGAFGVQSIPFVVAMQDGQPISQFMGAYPEAELRNWLDEMLPSPADELVSRGQELEPTDPQAAEAAYREAMQIAPENDQIRIHLARVILAQDRDAEAQRIIDELASRGFLEPEAESIKGQLELRAAAEEAGPTEEVRAAAQADPDNLELQLKLADALAVARHHQEALDICLDLIARDKAGIGPQAKDTMVRIFDMLGPSSELTSEYRRKLSTAWY